MASPTSCTPSLSCSSLRRQSSEIRAVCASERSYGSARGATSDGRPYRDHVIPDEQPVRFRSQVGVLTTAYRRGPEVRFGEVTWTCSRQLLPWDYFPLARHPSTIWSKPTESRFR